ncbi:MAG: Ribosomal silencing factor RsfA [uncultured Sphingomonadaceae bacterium]|uniref:Ribosomal silencing factor RsfS n=1 Tax=uncultured Sphingomonadaceae bacterium TaxID=169976 RepID=A0A6J4T677_9SPHN|nr:MAG: Ribosomal silencing factor RsfA [uncultured Sphingomonadaceae bacterium]
MPAQIAPVEQPSAPEHPIGEPIPSIEALHAAILKSLDDDQAVDVVTIPLAGKSAIADHMVICSGRSTRQVASMANKLAELIKAMRGTPVRVEGLQTADWVLLDADDVIVHIFRPEVRSFYNLERMWSFGEAPPPGSPQSNTLWGGPPPPIPGGEPTQPGGVDDDVGVAHPFPSDIDDEPPSPFDA